MVGLPESRPIMRDQARRMMTGTYATFNCTVAASGSIMLTKQ